MPRETGGTGKDAEQSYEPIVPRKVGNRRARAVTLAVVPAGENPVGGDYPVATVVIPGSGKGDRTAESPEVKVSVREASNSAGRSKGEPISPEIVPSLGVPNRWEPSVKASACREGTGHMQRQTPRGLRGRHAGREWAVKAQNYSRVA